MESLIEKSEVLQGKENNFTVLTPVRMEDCNQHRFLPSLEIVSLLGDASFKAIMSIMEIEEPELPMLYAIHNTRFYTRVAMNSILYTEITVSKQEDSLIKVTASVMHERSRTPVADAILYFRLY